MLDSGEKNSRYATKKINMLTLVLSEKNILNETKNHNPPLQVKWSVPNKDPHNTTHNVIETNKRLSQINHT